MRLLQQKTNGFAIISVCQGETKRGIPKGGAQLRHALVQPKREQVRVLSCVQCPSSQKGISTSFINVSSQQTNYFYLATYFYIILNTLFQELEQAVTTTHYNLLLYPSSQIVAF